MGASKNSSKPADTFEVFGEDPLRYVRRSPLKVPSKASKPLKIPSKLRSPLKVQSRSLSGRRVFTSFLDSVLGAMMKQVCWHSRRSKAYRDLSEARMAASRLLRMCWSSRGFPRLLLAPFTASSEK